MSVSKAQAGAEHTSKQNSDSAKCLKKAKSYMRARVRFQKEIYKNKM